MAFLNDPRTAPAIRVPLVVLLLIGALIAIACALHYAPAREAAAIFARYAFVPARTMAATGSWPDRAAPFVTYLFLPGGLSVLAMTCLWMVAFGSMVARRLGAILFIVFFLVCGAVAAGAYLAAAWGSHEALTGAFSAVCGLIAAGFRMLDTADFFNPRHDRPLTPIFSRRIGFFTLIVLGVSLLAPVYGWLVWGASDGLAPGAAMLGGYFAGLVLIDLFDRVRPAALEPATGPLR
jgi:membrane associated rhomboid family serine protease